MTPARGTHPPTGPAGTRQALSQGAQALGLALSEEQLGKLERYLALLEKWSRVYNLTAIRDGEQGTRLHLLDSLALIGPLRRHLQSLPDGGPRPPRLLDVGSGAGLPAVVIAIACPDLDVTAVDAVGKKAAFVTQAALSLGLPNLHARHGRVQDIRDPHAVVVSRAFASLADFCAWSRAALAPGGVWIAMKGRRPDDELAAVAGVADVFHVEPLAVPGLAAERCLVWMRPLEAREGGHSAGGAPRPR